MTRCAACRAENRDGAQFCRACGGRLAAVCGACGARLEARDRFCDRCGAAIDAMAGVADRFGSPRTFLPTHLAERILAAKGALEGERKHVTILLADMKGSLELLADRDPEDARKVLDPVLALMMDAVHHYEGTVNQVMGDGIMALFGAPIAHEDHAVRACYSALRIQEHLARVSQESIRVAGVPAQVRIGINSGDVVVRAIGTDLAMDYTAVGPTVHLAGRLEQMARPGTVLCSETTLRLVQGLVRARRLGPVPVKGLAAPVDVAEVVSAEPVRTRFQTAIARGLSPFVGRQDESETLRRALARAEAGEGHVVALAGEPGIGKSRLCWELARVARGQGWIVLETGGPSYGRTFAYGAVTTLLRDYFDFDDRDDTRTLREKVTSRLLTLDDAIGTTRQALMALLGVAGADREWLELDPMQRRLRTNAAVIDLLRRESRRQPVLLVLEDLHWVDDETLALLDECVDAIVDARVLIVATFRPEYQRAARRGRPRTELHVGPLPRPSAAALLDALVGARPGLETLKASLLDRTAGNALFLEETVRTLVQTGVLFGEPGDYALATEPQHIEVPPSVQAIIAARVDRLPPNDKALLEMIAAAGGEVSFALLGVMTGEPDERLRGALNRLRDAGFLYEARLYPELAYAFGHELVREIVYGSLVQERRRSLHAQLVVAAEYLYADRQLEHAEELFHHAVQGEVWSKAVEYGREAGLRAARRSAYPDAVKHLEQSLSALARLPESRETLTLAVDLRIDLRNALFPLGEVPRDLESLRLALPIAEKLGDRQRLAWLLAYVARDHSLLGQPDRALELGTQALALGGAIGERDLQVVTDAYLGSAHYAMGNYARAVQLLRGCLDAVESDHLLQSLGLPGPAAVFFGSWLVWALARLGEFSEGAQRAQAAIEIAAASEQPLSLAVASYSSGVLALHRQDLHAAVPTFERALELCQHWNLRAWFPNVAAGLGEAYTRAGRIAEGRAHLEQAVAHTEALGTLTGHAYEVAMLAETVLLSGDGPAAERLVRRALDLARTYRERGNEAVAMRVLAEVHAGAGSDEARALYGDAIALATELGMRPLLARCHTALAAWYRGRHDEVAAGVEASQAAELVRVLDIPQPLRPSSGAERRGASPSNAFRTTPSAASGAHRGNAAPAQGQFPTTK